MFDGPFAWLMVGVGLVLIFGGGKKLPDIGRGLGGFIREFKRAQSVDYVEGEKDKLGEGAEPKKLPTDSTPSSQA